MKNVQEIFVRLMNEGVDVWRPVAAQRLRGQVYRIVEQKYDRGTERWQFEPGELVVCERTDVSDGFILAAVRSTTD